MTDNLIDNYTNLDIVLGRTGIDKNSRKYDEALMKELIGLSVPINKFETELRKWFKYKSSAKLWWDNKPTKIWDGKEYHEVNYRCCPSSKKAVRYFCFVLNTTKHDGYVTIEKGYFEAI